MGKASDKAGIQYRMLNASKGPAVWGPRTQIDRSMYFEAIQEIIMNYPNLTVKGVGVDAIVCDDIQIQDPADNTEYRAKKVRAVQDSTGAIYTCGAVVITSGTFLNGKIYMGDEVWEAGRMGEQPANHLSISLQEHGFAMGRLKTGTPARLDSNSIDYTGMDLQEPDTNPEPFSYMNDTVDIPQIACHIAYTNETSHEIIRDNLHRSAMYSEKIEGVGPRYCPSIEDKVVRFADKTATKYS